MPVGEAKYSSAVKRFNKRYLPIANAVAGLDIDQEVREAIAEEIAEAIVAAGSRDMPDFRHDLFILLASDPLVPCAGPRGGEGSCPHGRVIRIGMHLSSAVDGRSKAWRRRAPYGKIRCVSCGFPT